MHIKQLKKNRKPFFTNGSWNLIRQPSTGLGNQGAKIVVHPIWLHHCMGHTVGSHIPAISVNILFSLKNKYPKQVERENTIRMHISQNFL